MNRRLIVGGALTYVGGVTAAVLYHQRMRAAQPVAPVSEAERRSVFNSNSAKYDEEIATHEWLSGISTLRKKLAGRATGRVLEVGVGTGRNFDHYRPSVERLVAVDFSAGMLDKAAARAADLGWQVHRAAGTAAAATASQYLADFEDDDVATAADGRRGRPALLLEASVSSGLPFSDCVFDSVVDSFGLCSYEDPTQALREMRRVLRPGGRLLLLEHGASSWPWLTSMLDSSAPAHAARHGCYWQRRIADLVAGAGGLRIEQEQRRHFGTTYYIEAVREEAEADGEAKD